MEVDSVYILGPWLIAWLQLMMVVITGEKG